MISLSPVRPAYRLLIADFKPAIKVIWERVKLEKTNAKGFAAYLPLMFLSLLLVATAMMGVPNLLAEPMVQSIQVKGNSRIPAASILRHISSAPNSPLDPSKLHRDLKNLYDIGVFEYVQLQSRDVGDGLVDLVCQVREYSFISSFSIEGLDPKLERQLRAFLRKEKLDLRPATPFKPAVGHKAALAVRGFLRSRKFPNADVQVLTEKQGNLVGVSFRVDRGQQLEIGAVRFIGNNSIKSSELLKQMRFVRPTRFGSLWEGTRYIPEELSADLHRLRLYYKSRGFAAMAIGEPRVQATGVDSRQSIEIEIPVIEGARYRLVSVKTSGNCKAGADEVGRIIGAVQTPGDYDYSLLEATRQKILDTLGHFGYALAHVDLEQVPNEAERTIRAIYRVYAGDPVLIGRIEFHGNDRMPDRLLRRELCSREGEVFDRAKLDRSVQRLNKSNLLQQVRRSDVALNRIDLTGLLDITFDVKEKERHGIYATGGTGGINGGYLGILYTAFNFLRLGETLSLQLDGGAAQSNMLLNIIGARFLGSPFTLALSIFNRYAGFNVANVVPGPESMIGVLRRRTKGIGLSGAYPVTDNLQVGIGFESERDSVSAIAFAPETARNLRSEVTPVVEYDRTSGTGPETRGYRLSYSHAWNGSLFLKSLDSMRKSIQLTRYVGDPWTRGRNSFAFHLQGSRVSPRAGGSLPIERRLYPGDENARGFSRGSLSPWALVPGNESLQPSGADTVLGFSTEYRVPIRGALSATGFFDLGWTHLDPNDAAQLGTGARLVDATNGVLRASLGGELRLQLPVIRQPARLIFSWNPLRLDTLFRSPSSVFCLAEPKTALRFALGALY